MLLQQEAYTLVHSNQAEMQLDIREDHMATAPPSLSPSEKEQKLVNIAAIALLGTLVMIGGFVAYLFLSF